MTLFNYLRKRSFIYVSTALILFVSCTQYEPINQARESFDYKMYEAFKDHPKLEIDYDALLNGRLSIEEINQALLDAINAEYGTSITLSDIALGLSDKPAEGIQSISLENGLLSNQDITLIDNLLLNLEENSFTDSVALFETEVLSMEITDENFVKYESFANSLKVLNDENPEIFVVGQLQRGWLACAGAILGLTLAIVGLVGA